MMDQPCPDPSVHEKHHKLSEQASTAALYATHPERNRDVLSPDGKLSSRSAAASLKYAKPQDLPSFPTHGIDTANSAGQAAMLAKDYKMKELWHPELSSAGSKAALLAHRDGGKLDLWQPSASADGNSAAKIAMRNKTLSPQLDYGYTKDGRSNALLAATKSQRDGRQRAGSTPVPVPSVYPDSANSAYNALNAATVSHRASTKVASTGMEPDGWDSAAMQAARIQNLGDHMDREMFTEKPPVAIELQEKRDKAALRASAISMAKQMYDAQNKTGAGSSTSDGKNQRGTAGGQTDFKQEAMRYIHLQDAAHKLAQERLAKIDNNFETIRYREYYGYNASPQRSRLSMSGFRRNRASSEAAKDDNLDSDDDEQQARRVRNQMSQFNTAVASVDAKKQQTDRDALLAVAQKRVQKSMHDMDAKVFQDTGKVSQAMMDEWEIKANKKAVEDAEKRDVNRGKTHIGGGKYMDNSEIEAIAQARLKPTLDEINENAERRRAKDEEMRQIRLEEERFKQQEKQRSKEGKEGWKRFKDEEKATAKKGKEERKDDPDSRRSFLSRFSSKQKGKETSKQEAGNAVVVTAGGATLGEVAEKVKDEPDYTLAPESPGDAIVEDPLSVNEKSLHTKSAPGEDSSLPLAAVEPSHAMDESDTSSVAEHEPLAEPVAASSTKPSAEDDSHAKSQRGIKGLISKLRPRKSHTEEDDNKPAQAVGTTAIVGSATIADQQHEKAVTDSGPVVASSVTEPPALPQHSADGNPEALSPSSFARRDVDDDDADISSLSSSGVDEDDFVNGQTGRTKRALGLPSKIESPVAWVPVTGEKLRDDLDDEDEETFEEARDTIDPVSAPEPSFVGQKNVTAVGRETKFQEEL